MHPLPAITPVVLWHRELGGSAEPPIVILHGLLGSSRNWQVAGRELAQVRRVVALDLRNHGQSPHSDLMSYDAMRADVAAWLESRGLSRVHVVGHSMGGKVAMMLACRSPELVSTLTVVDMAPRNYDWPAHRQEFAAMNELELAGLRSRAEAEARFETRVPELGMRKFLVTNLERRSEGGWKWQINLPVLAAALPALEANPIGPHDRFDGPALFIAGGKSTYVRSEDRAEILAHFPLARIETLPTAGHNPHVEARPEFVKAVLSAV